MFNRLTILMLSFTLSYAFSQCIPGGSPLNLGNDTIICPGQSLTLTAPNGYDNYVWSNGSGDQDAVVNQTGTYTVTASILGPNLVVNGDFEAGNTGFSSAYTFSTTVGVWGLLSAEATYVVVSSPNLAHNNFMPCADVTPAPGTQMMVVNGAATPGLSVWCQTVPVTPGLNYQFSAWISNALNDANVAQLQFNINGTSLGPIFSTPTQGCSWQQYAQTWNAGTATTAEICIVNLNTLPSGNDFMLDDIFFAEACVDEDTIQVTVESHTVNAGPDITFCGHEPETITGTASSAGLSLSWSNGTSGATLAPTTSGAYTLIGTSSLGCTFEDVVNVTVIPVDWNINNIIMMPTACGQNSGAISAQISGAFPPNSSTQYNWVNSAGENYTASAWPNIGSGWYYITVTNSGCSQNDSVFVDILDAPIAATTPTPASGFAPLNVAFSNDSQNGQSFFWGFGNGMTESSNNLSSVSTNYAEPGVYNAMLVAQNGSCFDTVFVEITVLEPPVIVPVDVSAPNVFTPNGDEINEVFTLSTLNISSLSIVVLNRWGNVVFESNDVDFEWDGKSEGLDCPEGVYFYKYTAKGAQDEDFESHGYVHLIRK